MENDKNNVIEKEFNDVIDQSIKGLNYGKIVIEKLRGLVEKYDDTLVSVANINKELNDKVEELTSMNEILQTEVKEYKEGGINNLKSEIKNLQKKLSNSKITNDRLEKEIRELHSEIENYRRNEDAYDDTIDDLVNKIKALKEDAKKNENYKKFVDEYAQWEKDYFGANISAFISKDDEGKLDVVPGYVFLGRTNKQQFRNKVSVDELKTMMNDSPLIKGIIDMLNMNGYEWT